MTFDPASGIRVKIERAKEHILDLESEIAAFEDRRPYGVAVETDPDGNRTVIAQVGAVPPERWGGIAGDAIHNMQAALDILWRRVMHNPGTAAYSRARDTDFPFIEGGAQAFETRFRGVKQARH